MGVSGFVRPRPRRKPQTERFDSGPWRGVRTTLDPLDDVPDLLYDAANVYNPDPQNASGFYQRPGFSLLNDGAAVTSAATPFRGQGIFFHTDLSTSLTYNFVVFNGKLFRADSTLTLFTDVTPVGVTIDSTVTTRVYGTSFVDQLIVTDGVNKPWLMTNLSATPVTGTYIQFNAANNAWTAFGPFSVYGGSAFCVLGSVNSVAARTDIAWSFAGDASVGWQQTNYDNRWTIEQTSTAPLYALAATNLALYYFRESSIGAISGPVGPDLATTATQDAVSANVGTQAPQNIVQFGTMIYFTDALGRPHRIVQGSDPEPIWLQMRSIVDSATIGFPGVNATVGTATFDPTLSLYIVAPFTYLSSASAPAVEACTFDALTGNYFGRFSIAAGVQLDTLGTVVDVNGRGVMIALGSATAPSGSTLAASGYVWGMNTLTSTGDLITTEDGVFVTTEDGIFLTSEGIGDENWTDEGTVPSLYVRSGRMGYDMDSVLNVDHVSALVGTTDPVQVSAQSAAVALTVEGTPTPSTVQDSVARIVCDFDGMQGRGVQVKVGPTALTDQWSIQAIAVRATVSGSPPDEP